MTTREATPNREEGLMNDAQNMPLLKTRSRIAYEDQQRLRGDAARADNHQPLEVRDAGGIPFIKCSCGKGPTVQTFLREHWQGSETDARAAIEAVVIEQRRAATPPPGRCENEACPACTTDSVECRDGTCHACDDASEAGK